MKNTDTSQNASQQPELFTIEILQQNTKKKILFLNNYQLIILDIISGKNLVLQVGAAKLQVKVELQNISTSPTTLYISKAAFNDLPYYQGESLSLVLHSDREIVLGPALGLTISKNTWKNINKSLSLKKRALLALEKGMLFYCYHLAKVDWKNGSVEAYCLNPKSYQWVKQTVPLPQIIYDRGSYPGPKTVTGFSNKGNVHNIQWINSTRTFGKWETFQALNSIPETSNYLPKTTDFSLENLTEFLKKYKYVFVKGNFGRNGRQVYRLEQEGEYYLCKTGGKVIKSKKFNSLEILQSFFSENLGKNFIVQQGISLAQINGCPFDMRILVQKNINGHWLISALNFRIAEPGAIVTNFAAGASDVFTVPGDNLLHPYLSWEKLEKLILEIVSAMETFFGSLGEIGLDVALDNKGKLWLLEANSRPSSIAYRESSSEACRQIFGLPLDYACHLMKKICENQEE